MNKITEPLSHTDAIASSEGHAAQSKEQNKEQPRRIWDIHGGIHPPENKEQSLGREICFAGIPETLILPLSQSIGAPSEPIVHIGDQVLKGQLIAEAGGYVSVPLHAPSSGIVSAIEDCPVPHSSGMSAPCIVITTDGNDQWVEHRGQQNYTALSNTDLLSLIRNAGISGMGGAGFPSAVKLNPPSDKIIKTLIINGSECEPYITADHALMLERANEIVLGIGILAQLLQPEEILIGIEDNKPDAIEALRAATAGSLIEVVSFPTKYPSGGEKQLIEILTGQQVPSGGLPADLGIICQNVGTCHAIKRAIIDGEPLISRVTTLTGNALSTRCNVETLIGTPVRFLLEQCGWKEQETARLIMGGPMMGFSLSSAEIPVVKTTNCLLAPDSVELPAPPIAQACIRCGMCAEACPALLLPQQLYWFARAKEYEKLETHNLNDCIECGACSYVCPSNIPLVQYYRASKAEISNRKQEQQNAEQSRERFEYRQLRLERQEQEKEQRRQARKAAAAKRQAEAAKKESAKSTLEGNTGHENTAETSSPVANSPLASDSTLANKLSDAKSAGDETDQVAKGRQSEIQAAIDRVNAKKATQNSAAKPAVAPDPAQAAIDRAKAKRAGMLNEAPLEKLTNALRTAEKRLGNTQSKLAQAQEQGLETVAMLETAVEKMNAKYSAAKQALHDYEQQA